MTWTITYYSDSVQEEILALPAGFLGRYLRYADRMEVYGPDLGMPHTKAMVNGLFELRLKSAEGIARVFYCIAGWPKYCHVASIRKKDRQNTNKRI